MSRRLLPFLLALLAGAARAAPAPTPSHPAGASAGAPAAETYAYLRLPILGERAATVPVAVVDDEVITLAEVDDALAATHGARHEDEHASGRDVTPVLDRLVTLRLFVAEAREMGLDEQPAFKKAVAEFEEQQLRSMTERRATRGLRPEALEVDALVREAVREWKVRSVLFAKKEDAEAFRAAVAAGKPFEAVAKEAVTGKRATGNEGADWIGRTRLLPGVAAAVARIQAAPACTDPVPVQGGWAVAAVEDVRYPDDPKARAAAEETSLGRQRIAKLERYRAELERKYARTDRALLKALDFEAPKPGFPALAKDRRTVVSLKGEKPITVADLAAELQRWFFHGVDEPLQEKKLNEAKLPALHKLLTKRLVLHAGRQAGIPATPEYRKAVAEYEDSLLFGAFVQKAIVPDVKVSEEQGKAYYEKHRGEFTYPGFYRLEGLAFSTPQAADAALKKLGAGTDFNFVRANADGQVKADERLLALDGQTFSANALPPGLTSALAGARRDDVRSFATGGQSYVVRVIDVTPPKEQPYAEVRGAIGKKLAAENLNDAVKEAAAKLRKSHQVSVYLERIGN